MRSLPFLSILVITVIVVGLLPRPLIKPNWRSGYDAAVKSQDCKEIERTIDLLLIVGLDVEGYAEAYNNHKAGRCKYAEFSEREVERAQVLGLVEHIADGQNYFNHDFKTSRFGRAYLVAKRKKYPVNKIVRSNERILFQTYLDSCFDKVPPVMGGFPNYTLLQYALNNPTISVDKIAIIARKQRAACAKKIMADLRVIASAATTPEEYISLTQFLFTASVLSNESPELGPEIETLRNSIPDETYKIAGYLHEEKKKLRGFSCDTWYPDRLLEGAIRCALHANSVSGTERNAEVFAVYFSRRAKRLGWRDISQIEDNAASQISAECHETIIQLEEQEVQNTTSPSEYRKSDWPLDPGEVCGPALDEIE